jgi:DNA topoisomerase-1
MMTTPTKDNNPPRTKPTAKKSGDSPSNKKLVIVESPTKEHTIQQLLGDDYVVRATKGHIRDLPNFYLGVDIQTMTPTYQVQKDSQAIVKSLKSLGKTAGEIYLATDPDREGEAIAWHVVQAAGWEIKDTQRVVFHAITADAVKEAFALPHDLNLDLVNAQQARRVLDRVVGFPLSKDVSNSLGKRGLSAGRVQSAALRLIADRDEEIEAFVPVEFWTLYVELESGDAPPIRVKLHNRSGAKGEISLPDKRSADEVSNDLKESGFQITSVTTKESKLKPRAPFITSTLQQDASRKLNFQTSRTMTVAQSLFEGVNLGGEGRIGLITYMRTDSPQIAPEAIAEIREYVGEAFGQEYLPKTSQKYSAQSKVAQEAHEAIRPASINRTPDSVKAHLKLDELRLYRLIWERAVASQMANAVVDRTAVILQAEGASGSSWEFHLNGSREKFAGWRKVYAEAKDEEQDTDDSTTMPPLSSGQSLSLHKLDPEQHFTRPKPQYNEASLVSELEQKGVGRPSTYASTIKTIIDRKYVKREGRVLNSTPLGRDVSNLLKTEWPDVVDIDFTRTMEQKLDAVANGEVEWKGTVSKIYQDIGFKIPRPTEETDFDCPRCDVQGVQRKLLLRDGSNGRFFACSGYPRSCRYTAPVGLDGGPKPPEVYGLCPACNEGQLTKRDGRNGTYFFCDNLTKCRYTGDPSDSSDSNSGPKPAEFAGACPQCSSKLAVRNGRNGPYAMCTGTKKNCGYLGPVEQTDSQENYGICPLCEQYPLVMRSGPRGPFIACSGFTMIKCSFTAEVGADGKPQPKRTFGPCLDPKCNGGEIVVRHGKRGEFYGCNSYPKCRFTAPRKKLDEKCPNCAGLLVTGPHKVDGAASTLCTTCDWSQQESIKAPEDNLSVNPTDLG